MKILQTKILKAAEEILKLWDSAPLINPELRKDMVEYATEYLEAAKKQAPVAIERDVIPLETTAELLLSHNLSSPIKRAAFASRETHYISPLKRGPVEAKLARRYKSANLSQLDKWLRRVSRQENKLRLAMIAAMGLPESKQKEAIKNNLALLLSVVGTQLVELQNEISDRESRCIVTQNKFPNRHNHPIMKNFAGSFEQGLTVGEVEITEE